MNISWKTILASLAIASLVACGSDDSEDPEPSSSSVASSSSEEGSSSSEEGSSSSVEGSSSSEEGSSSSVEVSSSSSVPSIACRTTAIIDSNITADTRLCKETKYELKGIISVDSGATLFVDAGVTVASGAGAALIVLPKGKIEAVGSAAEPIVFTSKNATQAAGDWGGIQIFGRAPVSTTNKTQAFEADPTLIFGGTESDDNSGTLKYVRIEFGGNKVALDKEFNNLTLGGVGSGTTLMYVQAHDGSDDNYEWFGGENSPMYMIATAGEDDGFDIDEGYLGHITYGIVKQGPKSDRGIESGEKAGDPTRLTNVEFKNITIINNKTNQAIHHKENVRLRVIKSVIVGAADTTAALVKVEGSASRNTILESDNSKASYYDSTYYLGNFKTLVDLKDTTDTANATLLRTTLAGGLISAGVAALEADLSITGAAATAKAGAIVDGNKWYTGWTTYLP